MTTIQQELNSLAPDSLINLFKFDTTPIIDIPTGTDVYYYTNQNIGTEDHIGWEGEQYTPYPFEFEGIERKADGTQLARPLLKVSNINKVFYAAFLALGDLSGCHVTRIQTCFKFTDNGSQPNSLATLAVNSFILVRKVKQDRNEIVYELASSLDRPGLMLPRRLILRDKTSHSLHAPGVSRIRIR